MKSSKLHSYNPEDQGIRVFIELGTYLQIELEEKNLVLKCEMIGMEVDKYLIVKVYQLNNKQRELFRNANIMVLNSTRKCNT